MILRNGTPSGRVDSSGRPYPELIEVSDRMRSQAFELVNKLMIGAGGKRMIAASLQDRLEYAICRRVLIPSNAWRGGDWRIQGRSMTFDHLIFRIAEERLNI